MPILGFFIFRPDRGKEEQIRPYTSKEARRDRDKTERRSTNIV